MIDTEKANEILTLNESLQKIFFELKLGDVYDEKILKENISSIADKTTKDTVKWIFNERSKLKL